VAQPNKDYWQGSQVTDYERQQYLIVPRKAECLDTIVDFCPFGEDDEIHVVDFGAGQGALSKRVLARFRRAYVTLFDASDEMVAVAKEQLAEYKERCSIVVGDFSDPDWHEPLSRPVNAVISNQALQYVRLERRAAFFQSVYDSPEKSLE
jgi:tRNA (cmo5U34)-methyltransferase